MKQFFANFFAVVVALTTYSQTTSTFESLSVPFDSFLSAKNNPSGFFDDGNVRFPTVWDTSFGGYWRDGFVPSSKTDKTTAGFSNLFSASTGGGFSSSTYAIAQGGSGVKLLNNAVGKSVKGFYVTNTTYAYLSMKDGDAFAKKFGGASGNEPDFFMLTVKGYSNGVEKQDSVNFYLADFRFADNNQDYILNAWAWVDLQALGNVDSLNFRLYSSDVGQFGMNTPSFFAVDNLITSDGVSGISVLQNLSISAYPNPIISGVELHISHDNNIGALVTITDVRGNEVLQQYFEAHEALIMPMTALSKGLYWVRVHTDTGVGVTRVIVH